MRPLVRLAPVAALALLLFLTLGELPQEQGRPHDNATYTDDYYLEQGQNETGANNIVSAVLFDYRGLDTMMEATVLFSAVVGVGALLHTRRKTPEEEAAGAEAAEGETARPAVTPDGAEAPASAASGSPPAEPESSDPADQGGEP